MPKPSVNRSVTSKAAKRDLKPKVKDVPKSINVKVSPSESGTGGLNYRPKKPATTKQPGKNARYGV